MDSNRFDILEIYRRFHDIRSGNAFFSSEGGTKQDDVAKRDAYSREALAQLFKVVESRFRTRFSIFDELLKLMARLGLMMDFSEFSNFYDFVFFICRENGQKNITVSRAVAAWRLVLAGRFRLLNQWCDFVEKNQRYNISEDTWQQVLAFSRCVHENLEGYDPEGAWPVLIDDFVERMYSILGACENRNMFCSCGDSESRSCEDSLPGLKNVPGLKRKLSGIEKDEMEFSETVCSPLNSKRSRVLTHKAGNCGENPPDSPSEDYMEIGKNGSPMCSSKAPCAVEGSLSKGFAGLFFTRSYLQFG